MVPMQQIRTHVPAGSFVSMPEAFPDAADAVKYAAKVSFETARFEDSKHPLKLEHVLDPHVILFDLEAVDAGKLDVDQLVRDCELVKRAAEQYSGELRTIVAAFAQDAPHDRILEAAKIAEKLELSEAAASKAGGGLLWLVVVAAAVALSGCKTSAHGKGATKQKKTTPSWEGPPP
jgi:hypothetical protein